jgi:nucleoid DNA-binding protein
MEYISDKDIITKVLAGYPTIEGNEKIFHCAIRGVFEEIANIVKNNDKAVIKNFGTFQQLHRKRRNRYDYGLKQTVNTEPKMMIQLIQSNNIFTR